MTTAFSALAILFAFILGLIYLSLMLDGAGRAHGERDRCLREAVTGYEMRACR